MLAELRSWIEVPQDLVEMYLNFDNDAQFSHMRLVYYLSRALGEIAVGKQVQPMALVCVPASCLRRHRTGSRSWP